MTSLLQQISERNAIQHERKRRDYKHISMFVEEILHTVGNKTMYGFLMGLALLRDDFPWIYDLGKELVDVLRREGHSVEKSMAIKEFRDVLDITFNHPIMRDIYLDSKDRRMFRKDMYYILMDYLENFDLER